MAQKVPLEELDLQRDGRFYQRNHIKPFSGVAYTDYDNGKRKSRAEFKDGKLDGKVTQWHRTGEKESVVNYKAGVKTGSELHWYPTGDKKLGINYDTQGLATGICREWYEDGQPKSEGIFEAGKEQGLHKWYFKNGQVDQSVEFVDGKANGKVKHFFEDGQLKLDGEYKEGQPHGVIIIYHENGEKKQKTSYEGGKEEGTEYFWSKRGLPLEERDYKTGEETAFRNYRSGALKTKDGYLQVFNEKESFFSVHINTGWVRPRASRDITYVIDRFVLQLLTKPAADIQGGSDLEDGQLLKKYMETEKAFIEKETGSTLEILSKEENTRSGQPYLHWTFPSPTLHLVKNPSSKTVIQEHYVSMVCGGQILSLYVPQTKGNDQSNIIKHLQQLVENVRVEKQRIDLNALRMQIRENAGLPPLPANETIKEEAWERK
jgi:antitoxin component YwqK of YwqJK toxin-antitoxin module